MSCTKVRREFSRGNTTRSRQKIKLRIDLLQRSAGVRVVRSVLRTVRGGREDRDFAVGKVRDGGTRGGVRLYSYVCIVLLDTLSEEIRIDAVVLRNGVGLERQVTGETVNSEPLQKEEDIHRVLLVDDERLEVLSSGLEAIDMDMNGVRG